MHRFNENLPILGWGPRKAQCDSYFVKWLVLCSKIRVFVNSQSKTMQKIVNWSSETQFVALMHMS